MTYVRGAAMEAGRKLGVEPVITAREMSDPDVDHLGIMAYVARLRSAAASHRPKPPRNSAPTRPSQSSPVPSTPALPPPPPPPPPQPPPLSPSALSPADYSSRSGTQPRASPVSAASTDVRAKSPLLRRVRIQPPSSPSYVGRTVSLRHSTVRRCYT